MGKILFSPVGMTDPIRWNHDGPMIHIIRCYQPEKVYLFYSGEAEKYEKKDQRYTLTVEKLGFTCSLEPIFSCIDDPSDFDAFNQEFPKVLKRITEENEGSEILVNISSGTPQMIAALCLEIASSRNRLVPVQVKTPRRESNIGVPDFNIDEEIKNLKEQQPDYTITRCLKPGIKNFRKALVKSEVTSLVKEYDYSAALDILEQARYLFENYTMLTRVLNHAKLRLNLQADLARPLVEGLTVGLEFYPVKSEPAFSFIEYLYVMKVKQKRGELSDLIIRVTPFVTELGKHYLSSLGLITPLTEANNEGVNEFKREKIKDFDPALLEFLDSKMRVPFRNHFVNISAINLIIKYLAETRQDLDARIVQKIKTNFEYVNCLEHSVRNKTAHEMISVTEEYLQKKSIKLNTSDKIIKALEELMAAIFPDKYNKGTLIFDDINEIILLNLE